MRPQEDPAARQGQDRTTRLRESSRVLERKTTLAAIAAAAGVSLPTVSKVVNGRPDVAPQTRARVERLLDEYNYARPGPRRHRRAGLIDLVLAGLDSPWAVEILRGVEEWGATHETGVAVSSVRHGSARPASWTSAVASHDSGGVILVTSRLTEEHVSQLRSAAIPLVVIDPANAPAWPALTGTVRPSTAPVSATIPRSSATATSPTRAASPGQRSCSTGPSRQRRSSPAATSKLSESTRPRASAACGYHRISASSDSTTCP